MNNQSAISLDRAVKLFTRRLREAYPKHKFSARIALRFVVDGTYVTQAEIPLHALIPTLIKPGSKALFCSFFEDDIKRLESRKD